MLFLTVATLLAFYFPLALPQAIDPNSVPLSTRTTWCTNQKSSCPLLCTQVGADNSPTSNTCDPVYHILLLLFLESNESFRTRSLGLASARTASLQTPQHSAKPFHTMSVKNQTTNVQQTAMATTAVFQAAILLIRVELKILRESMLHPARQLRRVLRLLRVEVQLQVLEQTRLVSLGRPALPPRAPPLVEI